VAGSHNKKLNPKELELIAGNTAASEISLSPGGAILMKPLLIRRFTEDLKDKKVRCIEIKFKTLKSY